ncbi:hypothetical protein E3E37_11035, partial [Thermococcus sp. ES12]|nr:hypothetical protein [Thermococcus sp. ES12]
MQLVRKCTLADNIKLFSTEDSIVLVDRKVHYLFEWVDYYIEVLDGDFEIFFGNEKAEKISDKLFKFTFRNYIGKSRLEIKKK